MNGPQGTVARRLVARKPTIVHFLARSAVDQIAAVLPLEVIQQMVNPRWHFELLYEFLWDDPNNLQAGLVDTDLRTLMGFYLSRSGQFDDFLLNESDLTGRLEDSVYSGQPIGVGDGATKNFQLLRNVGGFLEAVQNPANQNALVYLNGTPKTQGTDYTINNGIVAFSTAPAIANVITADFTFLHRVRFDSGSSRSGKEGLELSNFYFNLYDCKEVQLRSVRK